jgi:hypothetical protein
MVWLVVHLVATAVLTGVAWASLGVIYPAFALVGAAEWPRYHAAHVRAITRVIVVPWVAQGVSTAALLLDPPDGGSAPRPCWPRSPCRRGADVRGAVPAHTASRRGHRGRRTLTTLNRVHLVRSLIWTAEAVLAALLLVR